MKKRIFSAFTAVIGVVMFGILYPEYILLPDTYQYIVEKSCQAEMQENETDENDSAGLTELLFANPDCIVISSRFMQYLTDEGIVSWKNRNSEKQDMP